MLNILVLWYLRKRKIQRLLNALSELNCTIDDVVNDKSLNRKVLYYYKTQKKLDEFLKINDEE